MNKNYFIKICDSILRVSLSLAMLVLPCGFGFEKGTSDAVAQMVMPPAPGMPPHYFGPEPNWAYTPLLRKFVDSLPGLGAANANNLGQYIPIANADTRTYPGSDYYEIGLVEYREQMHSDLPAVIGAKADPLAIGGTRLRGYLQLNNGTNPATNQNTVAPAQAHYLGPLIIARKDRPVRVKFTNMLPTGTGGDLFIPTDTTVMGAGMGPSPMLNPDGTPMLNPDGTTMMEMYPQNRATLHLHGGNSPWISDGTAHQWVTPAGENTPYPKGVSVQNVPDMPDPGPGSITFYYTNQQTARLMFYHDHAYGITRLNVYAGEAAGYLLTDSVEEGLINSGVIPDQGTPAGVYRYGIPLVIQDKTFVDAETIGVTDPTWRWGSNPGTPVTGDLWMPHVYVPAQNPSDPSGMNPFGRWHYAAWFWPPAKDLVHGPIPNPYFDPINAPWEAREMPATPNPSMAMEAFMDTPLVNGTAYPYLPVGRKAYRLRILNAANDRFLNLQLYYADPANPTEVKMVPAVPTPGFPADWPTDGREGGVPDPATSGPEFIQIGTEGGFLPAPAVIPQQPVDWNRDMTTFNFGNVTSHALLLGCAERADVIVDFSQVPDGSTIILYNDAPAAFPALDPRLDYYTGAPDMIDTGGTISPRAGYGPNTRTIMQFRVSGPADPAFDLAALQAALPGAYTASQKAPIIPQTYYPAPYAASADTVSYIGDNYLSFRPAQGALGNLTLTNGGSGYTSAPAITVNGGGGTGATARASITNSLNAINLTGTVTDITIADGGTGYTTSPTVTITGGGGTGAEAIAKIGGGAVTEVRLTNAVTGIVVDAGGTGYLYPPTVTITGDGTGATAIATVEGGAVSGITVTNGGTGYTGIPAVTITGNGTGAVAEAIIGPTGRGYTTPPTVTLTGGGGTGASAIAAVATGGTGYTTIPAVTLTGGGGTGATGTAILGNGRVTSIALTNAGANYTAIPTVNFVGGGGTGASAIATISGAVTAMTITNPGSGYRTTPAVAFTGGGGTGAAAVAAISGVVSSISLNNSGRNYTTAPTVTFTGGGGTGATAVATVRNGRIRTITITNRGSGYTTAPTVTFTGGGGTGARATARISIGVNAITITNGGTGYTSNPTVSLTGGGGTGASATARISSAVTSLTLTNGGIGYTSAPTVTFTGGGGGTGAAASATMGFSVTGVTLTSKGAGYTQAPNVLIDPPVLGSGAIAQASITGVVDNIWLTSQGTGYTTTPTVAFGGSGGGGATATASLTATIGMEPKAIQDEMGEAYDKEYGRMSGKLGLELPFTRAGVAVFVLQSFLDPPTEILRDGEIQIWKITHNGVDTHPIHFHMFDVQLINRVAWDNSVSLPDPNEMGWKDTVRVSPLEDTIVALRPLSQNVPFDLPDNIRPLDPTMPLGSTAGFANVDPKTGNPVSTINQLVNFGWEYTWHCHILGHEEMDMMRPVVVQGDSLPGRPIEINAIPGDQQAVVSFFPPPKIGTSLSLNPITSYRVTANPGGRTATGTQGPITVTGLNNGTDYTFTVTPTNAIGAGTASVPSNSVTPGPLASLVPGAPTAIIALPGDAQATVNFIAPSFTGSSPIINYTVTSTPGGLTTTGTASPITVTGLTNGTSYTFNVTATNGTGTGPSSTSPNSVTPATPAVVPGAPTAVSAASGNGMAIVSFTAPASNGNAITGYTITSAPGGLTAYGSASPIAITGLTNGVPYTFTARATNAIGTGPASAPSNSVTPMMVPNAPTMVTAAAGDKQATVSFMAPMSDGGSPITGYTVISTPGAITVAGGASPITVTGLTNGVSYSFIVKANNALGISGISSPSNSVIPAALPDAPIIGIALAGDAQATVNFTAPLSDGGSPITAYTVTSTPGGITATGITSPIIVPGLTNGTAYTFTVTATTAVGTSLPSAASNSVIPATVPAAPTGISAIAGSRLATVSFTPPASDGGSPIIGYVVTSNPGNIPAIGYSSPISVTGLTNGTAYTFSVKAVNAVGTGAASAPSNSVTPVSTPPGAPIGVTALAGNGQCIVSFTPPASDGGSPIIGYTVTTSPGGITATGASSPITITGLTNGWTYTCTVTATSAVGTSLPSAPSNSVTPAAIPDAPTAVSAVAGDAQATVSFTLPVSSGGSPIIGYTATSIPGNIPSIGYASPITVTGLTNDTAYTFVVTATSAIGTSLPSTPSNSVTPTAPLVPGAPTGVIATPGDTQATVSFTPPASNGGSPITGYTVVSSPAGGVDANAGTTLLTHTITGLANGTAYTFTVTATSAIGTGAASAPSNSITPATLPGAPTGVSAVGGDTQAIVSFTAPASDGGSAITSYTVTSSPGSLTATGAASPLTVTGLTNGTAYTFTVTATNAIGTSAASAVSNSVTPDGLPTAPTTVTATPGNTQATVSFSGETANGSPITSYTVTSAPGGLTASGAASPLTVSGLTNGTAYTFTVTATNAVGTSAASATSNSVTPASVPGAPTIGIAIAGDATASVTFTAPASDGGSAITSYTVTSSPGGITATGAASPLTVTGLTNGTVYTFAVTATNAIGTSAASAASNSVTPIGAPGAPTAVAAAAGNTQATISFTAPSNGGSAITGYTVTSSPGGLTTTGASSPLIVIGLTNGTAYTFTVTATNAFGRGPVSAVSNSVTPATLPGAPTAAVAVGGNAQATVSFTAPASNGGSPITSYTVTSSPGGITATGAASPITVNGLTNGTAYTFTVTATNTAGRGPASAASNSVTPITVPGAPTIGVATAGDAQATISFTAPASNGGSPITGYTVTSNPGGITATGAASPITVTGLTNDTVYTFTVTATNATGIGTASAPSNSVTPFAAPPAPTGFTATASLISKLTTQVVLNWQETAASLDGFTIQRATDPGFGIGLVTFTVGAATRSYTDPGLTRIKTYYYRIQAYNASGTSAWTTIFINTP